MMFQMFSIALVMIFGAIVVNIYSYTGDDRMSQKSRRKFIRTLAPLFGVTLPAHLVGHKKIKKEDSVPDMKDHQDVPLSKTEIKYGLKPETETLDPEGNHDTMVKEWQTIALIMDRIFLCIWFLSNLVAVTVTLILI